MVTGLLGGYGNWGKSTVYDTGRDFFLQHTEPPHLRWLHPFGNDTSSDFLQLGLASSQQLAYGMCTEVMCSSWDFCISLSASWLKCRRIAMSHFHHRARRQVRRKDGVPGAIHAETLLSIWSGTAVLERWLLTCLNSYMLGSLLCYSNLASILAKAEVDTQKMSCYRIKNHWLTSWRVIFF